MNKEAIRNKFFEECTIKDTKTIVDLAPHNLFEWFWSECAAYGDYWRKRCEEGETLASETIGKQREEIEKYGDIANAMLRMSNELLLLREFVAEVAKGQQGELKGSFIIRIMNAAKKLIREQELQRSVARND